MDGDDSPPQFKTHTYNESVAEEVVSALLNTYFSEFETLLTRIEGLKQEESL